MVHILIDQTLQVAFHRGAFLVLCSILSTSMIYLKLFKVILPSLPITPSYLYRPNITPDDNNVLQSDLVILLIGVKFGKWILIIPAKCKYLSFGLNSPFRQYTYHGSSAELHQISTIDEENDLGITFSCDLKFTLHIHKKATSLGVNSHISSYLNIWILTLCICCILVWSAHTGTASNIWKPYLLEDMHQYY